MTTGEHILNVALRTAGRLLAAGILTREAAAALIRSAWCKAAADVLPAGATSSSNDTTGLKNAMEFDHWCPCGWHRASFKGGKCPSCMDDEARKTTRRRTA